MSGGGLPKPEPGLVISYSYLWHDEFARGREEGRKTRPAVIVMIIKRGKAGGEDVIVLPVTHSPPHDLTEAVEIPLPVKLHLGLDGERSWIVISEGNGFAWPGHDLRRAHGSGKFTYGFLPPRLFAKVVRALAARHASSKVKLSKRS